MPAPLAGRGRTARAGDSATVAGGGLAVPLATADLAPAPASAPAAVGVPAVGVASGGGTVVAAMMYPMSSSGGAVDAPRPCAGRGGGLGGGIVIPRAVAALYALTTACPASVGVSGSSGASPSPCRAARAAFRNRCMRAASRIFMRTVVRTAAIAFLRRLRALKRFSWKSDFSSGRSGIVATSALVHGC